MTQYVRLTVTQYVRLTVTQYVHMCIPFTYTVHAILDCVFTHRITGGGSGKAVGAAKARKHILANAIDICTY